METIQFELRKSYQLPVTKVIDNRYCIVEANGKEYSIQLYPFQQKKEMPQTLSCYVRDIDPESGEPRLKQNTSAVIPQLYPEDTIHTFKVKEISNHIISVIDENGFLFEVETEEKYTYGKKVDCRVSQIINDKLVLEIIDSENKRNQIPYYTVEQILEKTGLPKRAAQVILHSLKKERTYQEIWDAYNRQDEEWFIDLMMQLSQDIYLWAIHQSEIKPEANFRYRALKYFLSACTYLLEDSDMLLNYPDDERANYQRILAESSQNAALMLQAVDLIQKKAAVQTVDSILEKIERSGYLMDPDKKLKLLLLLMNGNASLMDEKMSRIFHIIIEGNHSSWEHEPFRKAFVEMLERYIWQNKDNADKLTVIHTKKDHDMHEKMIKALAIQQMLVNSKDNVDKQLNCALLLRYLTLLHVGDKKQLLEAALLHLAAVNPGKPCLQWNDCRNIDYIPTKMLSGKTPFENLIQQSFETCTCSFDFDGKTLEIHPLWNRQQEVAVPSRLLPSHHFKIFLPQRLDGMVKENERDLIEYQKGWKGVEAQLMDIASTRPTFKKKTKHTPEEGDEVTVIVTEKLNYEGTLFHVEIMDVVYEGSGTISTKDIINYELRTNEWSFKDNDGHLLKLKANIKSINPDGTYQFSMIKQVRNFIKDFYKPGDPIICRINSIDQKRKGTLLGVAELGISAKIKFDEKYLDPEDLKPDTFITAEVENFDERVGCVWAHYCDYADDEDIFNLNEAFGDCIYNLTQEGDIYIQEEEEEVEEPSQQQINMNISYIHEIIHIIDRMAVLEKDYVASYNYLSFARILTLILGDTKRATFYEHRLKLLQRLQHYADNKTNGKTMLKELNELDYLAINNPELRSKVYELKLMAFLDNPEKNEEIQNILKQETTDEHLRRLSQLVYCYNSLSGFKLPRERENIRKKFYEELGFTYDYKERTCYGEEDLHQEFKTSVVFPPENNMRADIEVQTQNILKEICGFLNAEGGTLYIGVNDDGLASGLEQDFAYLGNSDKFKLHIHNALSKYLGNDIDNLMKEEWIEDGDKRVFKLTIPKRSGEPVLLNGAYYRRQSNCTRLIHVKG